jgi:hypothetical protein
VNESPIATYERTDGRSAVLVGVVVGLVVLADGAGVGSSGADEQPASRAATTTATPAIRAENDMETTLALRW